MAQIKPVIFRGSSLADLRAFPRASKTEAGFQLDKIQNGLNPDDWKPMSTIGLGVYEMRIAAGAGAFRVVYIAKFANAVYVLHCFQKKTSKTSQADISIASSRYKDLLKERAS